jgi:hypothetical protein
VRGDGHMETGGAGNVVVEETEPHPAQTSGNPAFSAGHRMNN